MLGRYEVPGQGPLSQGWRVASTPGLGQRSEALPPAAAPASQLVEDLDEEAVAAEVVDAVALPARGGREARAASLLRALPEPSYRSPSRRGTRATATRRRS